MKLSLLNSLTSASRPQTKKLIPPPRQINPSAPTDRRVLSLLPRLASLNIRITVRPKPAGVPLTYNSSKREKAQTPTAGLREWREISLEPEAEVAEHTPRPATPRYAPPPTPLPERAQGTDAPGNFLDVESVTSTG